MSDTWFIGDAFGIYWCLLIVCTYYKVLPNILVLNQYFCDVIVAAAAWWWGWGWWWWGSWRWWIVMFLSHSVASSTPPCRHHFAGVQINIRDPNLQKPLIKFQSRLHVEIPPPPPPGKVKAWINLEAARCRRQRMRSRCMLGAKKLITLTSSTCGV